MRRLILAGGGHAHLQVLKALADRPWPGVEVVLLSPQPRQFYSGMLPGWIAGHYRMEQCATPLAPLAAAAGARFVQDRVTGVDARRRCVLTAASGEWGYDLLSLDTGAELDCARLAAAGDRLLPLRPLAGFVTDWPRRLAGFVRQGSARVAVVGGGAGGVELALAAAYRLARELAPANVEVSLIAGSGLMRGHGPGVVARVGRALARRGVAVHPGYAEGDPEGLRLDDGTRLAADCVIAATGARPAPWLAESGLALAADGFLAVIDGQQSASHPAVFAAGDVASRIDAPHAKSGVYAVRAGPVLAANLERALHGQAPLGYRPQKRSLYLLATGPREAIVSWGGLSAGGRWAWRWKDHIDRGFVGQYVVDRDQGRQGD